MVAFSGHDWCVGKWSSSQHPPSIAYKELFPVVVATSLWGHRWATERVEFRPDNMAVVSVLSSGTSKDPNMMVLLRYLSLIAARNSFAFTTSYTLGRDNSIADALSRFWLPAFPSFSTTCSSCDHTDPTISAGAASHDWTEKCQFYSANGLAPSTHQVYGLAQCQFLEFCSQDIPSDLSHPLLPASEQALMCFCAHLADRLHHSSVKVNLSAVRSLHIDCGCPGPLSAWLRLRNLLDAVQSNLMELTTRSTSLTSAVSGKWNVCSCARIPHALVPQSMVSFGWHFSVSVTRVSVSPERGDSLFWPASQRFGMYANMPGMCQDSPGSCAIRVQIFPSVSLWLQTSWVFYTSRWSCLTRTMSCYGRPVVILSGVAVFISLGSGSAPLCPVLALTNYLHLRDQVLGVSSFFRMAVLVKGPPIFISASHLTGSWHSGEVLRPQLENWRCYYSRPERHSWPPH